MTIDSGPLVQVVAPEAVKRRDYEPVLHDRDERMRVVVGARDFDSWYRDDPRSYLGKLAELHHADGTDTWRVAEFEDGDYAHTITLVHQDNAA